VFGWSYFSHKKIDFGVNWLFLDREFNEGSVVLW
jgi:hypothetical protein